MYNSPVKLFTDEITRDIAKKQDALVFNAVARLGVTVDRDELLRALRYDRGQYDKGYADGKADGRAAAMAEIVRCKECIHYDGACLKIYSDGNASLHAWQERNEDDFCSYGEGRDDDA